MIGIISIASVAVAIAIIKLFLSRLKKLLLFTT